MRARGLYVIAQLHGYAAAMMTPQELVAAAHTFALLGDPTRLRILHTVMEGGEMSVGSIAETAGTSRFNASAHLNRLALGGLVARRREASTVYYRVEDQNLPQICEAVCASLRSRAAALAARM
jgi:DNA-binding transcriptional ArsR family regulator